ncbi:MAG: hypothetical protein IT453_05500, partial [Planctomycetes bacterium]|nr:hypothetical protein [Planctomycetota bacterium]
QASGSVVTRKGDALRQPIAFYSGTLRVPGDVDVALGGFEVRGSVAGPGVITLIDGTGARASVRVHADENGDFRSSLHDFDALLPTPVVPRFVLELSNDGSDTPAKWGPIATSVDLPCPPTSDWLQKELHAELDWIFRLWLERGLDREGPRETSFTCNMLDVVTGAKLVTVEAVSQPQPLYELMLDAWVIDHDPAWGAALERYVEEFLTLGIQPDTGIPRQYDCVRDEPLDRNALEIAKAFHFLLDLAEKGPEEFRERALAAGKELGETVLAKGVLPDGSIAPIYVPADASPRTDAPPLRRLDVAAELARLSKLTGDPRFAAAARRAIAEIEFTNHWPGEWDRIDPGFDDSFGHYGARAVTMLEAFPDDPVFRRVVASGWRVYGPLWSEALRFGGSMAADQVRCWDLLERYMRLEPAGSTARAEFRRTLALAVRAHFKGEQYGNGAWGDVTYQDFDPKIGLSVGDLPGAPANLLWGLGIAHRRELALDDASLGRAAFAPRQVEAMFLAVFLSTRDAYKRPYGYLSTQRERTGANPGAGELRVARGLIEMLATL